LLAKKAGELLESKVLYLLWEDVAVYLAERHSEGGLSLWDLQFLADDLDVVGGGLKGELGVMGDVELLNGGVE